MSSNGGSIQLTAQPRTEKKGSAIRGLRSKGRIPAVVYGSELEGIPVHVDAKEFNRVVRTGRSEVFNLTIEGKETIPVIIKDYQQRDNHWLHADFLKISKNKPLRVRVSIDYQGTPAGTKKGGILQVQETEVEVEGLPADLPSTIEVDVSALEVGDKVSASDLKLPKGVTLHVPGEELLASIIVSRAAEVENAAVEGDAAATEGAGETSENKEA
ncbi:50S ribosomal protein L25 [Paenibacillus sp. 1-18]|uniref:50S ribosomal protein L25 n=1 Tax=Paenibacillus sp. 1-18 TaxID=1333846 RepID=UPI0004720A19|nr:50S ribosomal protein L25 [Paenibacillus sp. 1-18]